MIRRHYETGPTWWGAIGAFLTSLAVPLMMLRVYIEVVDRALRFWDGSKSSEFTLAAAWEKLSDSNAIVFTLIASLSLTLLCVALFFLVGVGFGAADVTWRLWQHGWFPQRSQYRLPAQIATAVRKADMAYKRPPGSVAQQQALSSLARTLHYIYDEILRISGQSVTVTHPSRRGKLLREHHLKVIGALEEKEAVIDVDVRTALPELAETLTRIVNNYSAGKIGQLLPASEIDHATPFEPVKRNHFKMAAVAVLLGGCGVLVAFLDLPEAATTSLIGAIGITIVSIIYGPRAREGLDFLDSVRGIQRP